MRWLAVDTVLRLHEEVLLASGGSPGVLNAASLESALSRPGQIAHYAGTADVASLAAAYCWGLIRNHPFVDGNKRTALLTIAPFLAINGLHFEPGTDEAVEMMLRAARREIDERTLADWIRASARPRRNR